MKKYRLLLPIFPALVSLYIIARQYLYFLVIINNKLQELELKDFYISINTGSPDFLKLYLTNTYIFSAITVIFIVLTILNTVTFKREWIFNLWIFYVIATIIFVVNITTYFTTMKYGIISYGELLRKDSLIERLKNSR